jgi:ferric-dicitrate binding protein FerR (iron transport regulator)
VLAVKQLQVSTRAGARERVLLPDGSEVWLNAASTLSYPEKFGATREVLLQGEAFFKVSKDKSKPFIIRTGNFYTTVLGTSFNIKAYDADRQVRVSVATGKVAVSVADTVADEVQQLALLTPQEQITYYHDTRAFQTERIAIDHARSWMNGALAFKQASVMEVASTLQRWYGTPVEVVGITANTVCTFTANFKEGASLHDVLETLSLTRKIDYSMEGDKAVIVVRNYEKKIK